MGMRIAIVTHYAFTLGKFRAALISEMVRMGHTVYALAPDYDEETTAQVVALGAHAISIRIDRSGLNPVKDFAAMVRLARTLRGLRLDIVFSYFLKPVIQGSMAAWLAGVRNRYSMVAGLGYIFTERDEGNNTRERLLRVVVVKVLAFAFFLNRKVFFQNPDDREFFISAGALEGSKAVVIDGSGVDLAEYAHEPLPDGRVRFLFVGRLLKEKGLLELVEAARIVRTQGIDCEVVVAGEIDSNRGSLTRREVSDLSRDACVTFLGHVTDIKAELRKSTVFVLPSYREGKPRSTQEALAVGRPVITTDAIGCRNTVSHGVNGWLVPVGDAQALAEAMKEAVLSSAKLKAMGIASRRLAEYSFDVHRINASMLETMQITSAH